MGKISRFGHWLRLRSAPYIAIRLFSLLQRYGVTPIRAEKRVLECVRLLARYGCYPTFPTPGRVVHRNAPFCRELQALGAELIVHGYDHMDFLSLSRAEAASQFTRAADSFDDGGIRFEGFRCPYLSYTDQLLDALPQGRFEYSSNKAIWWDVAGPSLNGSPTAIFESLQKFYRAEPSPSTVSTPRMAGKLVEIPVSLPDDLQLHDGLKLGEEGMTQAWTAVLHQTHRTGELFVLLFHPELFEHCKTALVNVLKRARLLQPVVWITQLRDISRWWREKSGFDADIIPNLDGLETRFHCSDRATILLRNLSSGDLTSGWDGVYRVLEGRTLHLASKQRPFIGAPPDTSPQITSFLQEQGYIVDTTLEASRCTLYLAPEILGHLANEAELVQYIESSPAPLARFWRWPDRAKSALCVSGDLDALSLLDYTSRLFAN